MSEGEHFTVKPPPHSVEAEQSVIGAVLLDNRAWDRVADLLRPADFYRHEHRVLWGAISTLLAANKPADIVTVFEALSTAGQAGDVGGVAYISAVMQSVPSAANAQAHANIVRLRATCRQLLALSFDLGGEAHAAPAAQGEVDAVIDRTMLRLIELHQGAGKGDAPRVVAELLPAWMDALEERASGKTDAVPTGLHDVDRLMSGGMRPGELIVIGARPSMGKSALSLTIARNVSALGPVLVCSMEDSQNMLISRQVAAAGRVNLADIRSPERAPPSMWQGVTDGVQQLAPLLLHIDDCASLNLRDVRRKAMQVRATQGALRLVIVDYLQLMEGDGNSRHEQLSAIAAGLKRLAKELHCTVILLSQLNREADKTDGPPRLDHLRESGGIEEAADIVGLLWREARRKPKPDNKHTAQIEFAKHKNGPTDTIRLWFDGATQRFADWQGDAHGAA